MNRSLLIINLIIFFTGISFSQRILFQSDFETIPLIFPDSLPAGWKKLDVDHNNPLFDWAVRDTNYYMGSGDTSVFRTQAHSGKKSLFISWLAGLGGTNLNDDWVWSDSLNILSGDSLKFWMLIGATNRITAQYDSVQLYITSAQNPNSVITKLATIKSNDSAGIPKNNNVWTLHQFDLSAYNGQKIFIAWRYYIVVNTFTGLWVNIDDVFIGNRSFIGIKPVSSQIPSKFGLNQNYPNPFNPFTKIRFNIPYIDSKFHSGKNNNVIIIITNSLGQQIESFNYGLLPAGQYEVTFDGIKYPSGTYFYTLSAFGMKETKKLTLIK